MGNDILSEELDKVKQDVLKMGRLLEEQVFKATKALVDKNMELAREVISNEDVIDRMELEIEKKALGLIALKQPMARDLRLIASILRMIVDIERMADHAEDIALIAIQLHDQAYIKPLIDIPRMGAIARDMVENALQAFVEENPAQSSSLVYMEKEMDGLYDQIFRELLSYMMQDHKNIPQATSLLLVAGHLERIGDHATNLAEMVFYLVEGRRVDLNKIARTDTSQ
ncbi:phosphate signaling complex protein PhoU [Syntrophomonas palmitatica]|uniref:phosphate signaling complex protein PhoU n=1 Tax=Syntrophomonas palmitatica TaxID=402877 RepID=UPI0006D17941|nr:phosphate signaling complex protein PhoU [Syntrophomonas palmitatica]